MSLNKAIEHKKEHRKKYYGSKAFDSSCRPHGGCPTCEGNRKHKDERRKLSYNIYETDLLFSHE